MNSTAHISRKSLIIALVGMALAMAGCTKPNKSPVSRAYCDDSGCFQCDIDESCWPVENRQCQNGDQCGLGETCTSVGCATSCSDRSDCGADMSCVSGFCVAMGFPSVEPTPSGPCTTQGDCADSQYCDLDSGKCTARCESDDNCAPGQVCLACGKCQERALPATCGRTPDFCDESVADSCGEGKQCRSGRCHYECDEAFVCPVGQSCGDGLCLQDTAPDDSECIFDADCGEGACINGACHDACDNSEDCGDTMLCQTEICQPDYRPATN